jgi:hypothetical protein
MSNTLPSERAAVVGVINATAQTAGAKNSTAVDCKLYRRLVAVGLTGTLGTAATVDGKWQQSVDAAFSSPVDITGGAITQIVKASGDNKQFVSNLNTASLSPGYEWVRFVLTVGTATSDAGVVILGFDPLYGPASDNDLTSVVQIASV